jgi:hypothetical protein
VVSARNDWQHLLGIKHEDEHFTYKKQKKKAKGMEARK